MIAYTTKKLLCLLFQSHLLLEFQFLRTRYAQTHQNVANLSNLEHNFKEQTLIFFFLILQEKDKQVLKNETKFSAPIAREAPD